MHPHPHSHSCRYNPHHPYTCRTLLPPALQPFLYAYSCSAALPMPTVAISTHACSYPTAFNPTLCPETPPRRHALSYPQLAHPLPTSHQPAPSAHLSFPSETTTASPTTYTASPAGPSPYRSSSSTPASHASHEVWRNGFCSDRWSFLIRA